MAVFFFLASHTCDEKIPCGQPAPCGQTALWSHPYSSQLWPASTLGVNWLHGSVLLSFESPLWWGNYMRLASILWPDSTLVSSLLTLMWPVSTQSPRSWDDFTGVFFFLLIYPGVEKTPCGQPAPCSQTAPWSHPYIPMWPVSTQSPSRLQSPWRWVNTMRPASILWLDSTLVPPRLIPMWPVSTLDASWQQHSVLFSWEST